jgi:RNA polymerase sigma-70 factor (ECF subfamily)
VTVSTDARTDDALMQALGAGDLAAFQALYERHHRALFTFLIRYLGARRLAEDLLQETFLRVFARRAEYHPTAAFRSWLFTIARNLVIDHSRRANATPDTNTEDTLEMVAASDPSPLAQAEAQELVTRFDAAIGRLPPSQRDVLLLSRFAGLSHEEVARVTGGSPGAVRVTLHRALRRLRDRLGPL